MTFDWSNIVQFSVKKNDRKFYLLIVINKYWRKSQTNDAETKEIAFLHDGYFGFSNV